MDDMHVQVIRCEPTRHDTQPQPYHHECDVFSAGCMMFAVLSGYPAFPQDVRGWCVGLVPHERACRERRGCWKNCCIFSFFWSHGGTPAPVVFCGTTVVFCGTTWTDMGGTPRCAWRVGGMMMG